MQISGWAARVSQAMSRRRMDLKKATYVMGLVALFVFTASVASAQNPSAKFAATVSEVTLIPTGGVDVPFTTVLSNYLKTGSKKDLLIGVSLQTGLITDTTVKSKNGELSTAQAVGKILVRVLVDGVPAHPAVVVYDMRLQRVEAQFSGLNCTISITTGLLTCTDPEVLRLLLETMAAHHFNFVAANLAAGDHIVVVEVAVDLDSSASTGALASAQAGVGVGSLTIEEVRATNNPDGIIILD